MWGGSEEDIHNFLDTLVFYDKELKDNVHHRYWQYAKENQTHRLVIDNLTKIMMNYLRKMRLLIG